MVAKWLKAHLGWIRALIFVSGCAPLATLYYRYQTDSLGANPLETLTTVTGSTAVYFLVFTLLVTPLRRWLSQVGQWRRWTYGKRVSDWNTLVKLRRQLGLWSFAYALAHALVFLAFDVGWHFGDFSIAMWEKPYLMAGALALVLLTPLALTSPMAVMRRMGRTWLTLHRSVYVVALLVVVHFSLQVRAGTTAYVFEALALAVLLGYRLALKLGWIDRWSGHDGLETPERIAGKGI